MNFLHLCVSKLLKEIAIRKRQSQTAGILLVRRPEVAKNTVGKTTNSGQKINTICLPLLVA